MPAYLVSRQWLALLLRRMDAVASLYRLAASLAPGTDGQCSQVDCHRRGRLRAIAEYPLPTAPPSC